MSIVLMLLIRANLEGVSAKPYIPPTEPYHYPTEEEVAAHPPPPVEERAGYTVKAVTPPTEQWAGPSYVTKEYPEVALPSGVLRQITKTRY